MIDKIQNIVLEIYQTKKIRVQKSTLVFFIFVLISSFIWFLFKMNRAYNAEVIVPVKYINFPTDKFSINALPQELQIQVHGLGWKILKRKVYTNKIIFDINALIKNHKQHKFTILTKKLQGTISKQISSELSINGISPDSLNFRFTNVKSKRVLIVPNFDLGIRKQYELKDKIAFSPDSVTITGPDFLVDKTKSIKTNIQEFKDLHSNEDGEIELSEINDLTYSIEKTNYNFEIERLTETNTDVKISVINIPDSLNIKFFPSTIKVTYSVGISKIDKYNQYNFKIDVDYNKLDFTNPKIPIKITKMPEAINSLYINSHPKDAEYLIETVAPIKQ